MTKVLFHPGIIDWTKEYMFDIPPHFQDVLSSLLPAGSQLKAGLLSGHTFVASPKTMQFSLNMPTADISVSEVRQEDVSLIVPNWIEHPETPVFLRRLINANLPTVCLRLQTGQPVAYCLTHLHNLIGMLHVMPNHRKQGLAKVCVSYMAQNKFKEEEFVGARVRYYNGPSQKVFLSCGFVRLPEANDYSVMEYYPPK
ncbi:uncharacterized protein LOC121384783 [Gigantopelta aegis]|uniref:uncharacterized protein LOC121384783 n=1 Tax=Gigantopelta aegis TaxID=1735272 RepID=UPI001B888FFA|nr:uncharacterized protein LOC121384783 [Gigantopelta aegis]